MKRLFITAFLITSSLQAISLSELINASLQKSPSLDVINKRIAANEHAIDVADQFDNPEILLTKNTIGASQAMSQTVITLKQKVPYYSKRQKRAEIKKAQKGVLTESLRDAKVKLVEHIKEEAYRIWELREIRSIIDEYIEMTKNNIRLYESYTSVSDNQHMGIMKAELSLSDLEVQRAELDAKIDAAYARLSYLSALKVTALEINLTIEKRPNLKKLENSLQANPDIALQNEEIRKQRANVALADVNKYPDVNLVAGYAYREKFDNYFNFGVALKLPIYGTEEAKEEEARAILLAKQSQKSDTLLAVNAELRTYYAQMLASYNIYHIINDQALPQVAHMFELSSSSIATGSDLFKYIDVLFEKLNLEKKSIVAITNYKRAQAQIAKLRGDLQ